MAANRIIVPKPADLGIGDAGDNWQQMSYGDLLAALHKDLLPDASVDLLPGSLTVALTSKMWTPPSLINAWANTGAGFSPAGFIRDSMGFVHCRGNIVGGVNGSICFVLPVGFRPVAFGNYAMAAGNAGSTVYAQVAPTGAVEVVLTAGTIGGVSLENILFLAEN